LVTRQAGAAQVNRGLMAAAAEAFTRRFSLCCGREGCRRRATPPSIRFLGRRVYVGAAVIIASVVALAMTAAGALRRAIGEGPRVEARASPFAQRMARPCSPQPA
jgi:hypothetical protein